MSTSVIYLPFPKELYDDMTRFSDGSLDVVAFAIEQMFDFMERNIDSAPYALFGSRALDFLNKYFSDYAEEYEERIRAAGVLELQELLEPPLKWKEVSLEPGTTVRMNYSGRSHFAKVKGGRIIDKEGEYSPSEWASKIANGTSRNAWRDLEFRAPKSTTWVPAHILRRTAQEALKRAGGNNAEA